MQKVSITTKDGWYSTWDGAVFPTLVYSWSLFPNLQMIVFITWCVDLLEFWFNAFRLTLTLDITTIIIIPFFIYKESFNLTFK